jgi:glycosyltransferase involved in cell wall biosynthesis
MKNPAFQAGASGAPLISIVIPAYNCERFIMQTVGSIQAQTLRDWECVIVDDGSTDTTLALIRELAAADGRFRTAAQPNRGPAAARNHGLELIDSRSQYISFMDSDDVWLPEALEALKTELEKYPEVVGVHGVGRCIDQNGAEYLDPKYKANGNGRFICDSLGRIVFLDPSAPTSFQSLWFSNPFPPGLILARRGAYEKVGSFDASVCPLEDWDMMVRLSRHGDFRLLEKLLLSYRRHDNNLSGQSASVTGHQIRGLLHKTFFSAENDAAQRKIVRQNWRATELLHLRQKVGAVKEHLAGANLRRAASAVAGSCVHLYRFARGYPTLNGFGSFRRQSHPTRQTNSDPVVSHNPT